MRKRTRQAKGNSWQLKADKALTNALASASMSHKPRERRPGSPTAIACEHALVTGARVGWQHIRVVDRPKIS